MKETKFNLADESERFEGYKRAVRKIRKLAAQYEIEIEINRPDWVASHINFRQKELAGEFQMAIERGEALPRTPVPTRSDISDLLWGGAELEAVGVNPNLVESRPV